jgi:two-component system, sensor histidine kinase and response regulator
VAPEYNKSFTTKLAIDMDSTEDTTSARHKYNVLVVDDVYKNIPPLKLFLSGEPYLIDYSLSGEEALEKISAGRYDLILLDVMMPGMDGFEVCTRLKRDEKTRDIPVIFLTARTEREDIVRGFEFGAVDYIAKPFHPRELIARVRTHLELREKTAALDAMNHQLERKVEQRTARLAEANRKLARFEQAKSDFLTLVSHELRTPLNDLLGFSSLMTDSALTAEQQEYFGYIQSSIARLQRFIDASLLVTSVRTDKLLMRLRPIPVEMIVKDCIADVKILAESRDITVEAVFTDAFLSLSADFDLIHRCLRSLLENAVKYSHTGGRVVVGIDVSDETVSISVRDFGPGFSDEAMSRVFTFFASDDIMHHHEGLGLGLATAKLIMDAHDGTITAENHPDGGALLRMDFPAKYETRADRQPAH